MSVCGSIHRQINREIPKSVIRAWFLWEKEKYHTIYSQTTIKIERRHIASSRRVQLILIIPWISKECKTIIASSFFGKGFTNPLPHGIMWVPHNTKKPWASGVGFCLSVKMHAATFRAFVVVGFTVLWGSKSRLCVFRVCSALGAHTILSEIKE